jgi:hypothetical protein
MGCLARLGCLIVLLAIGVAAYLTRDRWMDKLPWGATHTETSRTTPAGDSALSDGWMPLTQAGATRTTTALQKLSTPRGPVFLTLSGGDVASYVFLQIVKQMPASADSFAARIDDDHIRLRARMKTADLGGAVTGVLGALIGERERVEMAGTLRVIGPGRAEFRVDDVRVHDVRLPDALIARLVRSVTRGARAPGLDERGLPISIPSYIGDVRVSNGKITLYKNVQ